MIFMAYADWMQAGDIKWLAAHYPALKAKLQLDRARADGLIISSQEQMSHDDLIDWPPGERDGYVFTSANTVVNAFHLRALCLMARMALALHQEAEAADFLSLAKTGQAAFQEKFFDARSGLYRDGEGTSHMSLHANLFPLAFGLVPDQHRTRITRWLAGRGMACSVYAAQYLLEGLFENDSGSEALALMAAPNDRSWKHMVNSGATITWEAWDQRYKPNQDWNHVWGAAPANLIPRYVLGVQPLVPGWRQVMVRPNPGPVGSAEGKIPTPRGPIILSWKHDTDFKLSLNLPPGISAQVQLPADENA